MPETLVCPVCGGEFYGKRSLGQHRRWQHPEQSPQQKKRARRRAKREPPQPPLTRMRLVYDNVLPCLRHPERYAAWRVKRFGMAEGNRGRSYERHYCDECAGSFPDYERRGE